MISMSKIYSIRQMRMQGHSITEIAKYLDISRDTVYKYLDVKDLSPRPPTPKARTSVMDQYRSLIESWLDEDERTWRKQRHTAHRIWFRLRDEQGAEVCESTVRNYVRLLKLERGMAKEQFLDLDWASGEAQADFGEADFYFKGVKTRLYYFVLVFLYSNVGYAQVFRGENSECVCQALQNIFEYVGGVPHRIVFDNAAGIGRRIGDAVSTAKMFSAFAAHYGFAFSFCNPAAGHEKGTVEKKVGYLRSNLFVPLPQISNIDAFNTKLLEKATALSDKPHWIKGEWEIELFVEDRFALSGLPEKRFAVIDYVRRKADKYGKVKLDGVHLYSTDPALAGRELICGLGANRIEIYADDGSKVCAHERQYGGAPTDSCSPASQLPLLCTRPGVWLNNKVRGALSDTLRDHMDSLSKADLKEELRIMRDQNVHSGWEATRAAFDMALNATGRIDRASVAVCAARLDCSHIAYDDPVDLEVYDIAIDALGAR